MGSASSSFHREGGPLVPHEEMKRRVEEAVGVVGAVKKADVVVARDAMAKRDNFMMMIRVSKCKWKRKI